MLKNFNNLDWLSDFQQLQRNHIFSMNQIDWWLLKYSGLQKETHDLIYGQHIFELEDGSTVRLPPFGKKSDQEIFLDLYESLDTISQFRINEKYFEQEMTTYHQIKKSKSDLKTWAAKNEDYGADKYVCFLLDYLDYDEDEKVEHLNVFVRSSQEIDIFIDRQDFRHTIEFLEIFNDLYWIQEILQESLEK